MEIDTSFISCHSFSNTALWKVPRVGSAKTRLQAQNHTFVHLLSKYFTEHLWCVRRCSGSFPMESPEWRWELTDSGLWSASSITPMPWVDTIIFSECHVDRAGKHGIHNLLVVIKALKLLLTSKSLFFLPTLCPSGWVISRQQNIQNPTAEIGRVGGITKLKPQHAQSTQPSTSQLGQA